MRFFLITELYPVHEDDWSITHAIRDFVNLWDENITVFRPLQLSVKHINKFGTYFRLYRGPVRHMDRSQLVFFLLIKCPFVRKYFYLIKNRQNITPPEVIIGHSLIGNYVAKSMSKQYGVPFSAALHNYDLQKLEKEKDQYVKVFQRASLIACRSYSIQKRFNGLTDNQFSDLTFIANSGIDLSLVEGQSFFSSKAGKFDSNHIRFITAARLEPLKNIDINIEVMSELSQNYTYSIIGDGQDRERIQSFIDRKDLGKKIRILGWKKPAEVLDYLKEADIFIMASAPETFGLAYLEAMAKGCIVIGAYGWGIDGIIRNGENGFLVEPGDMESLKNTLNGILSLSLEEREKIGHSSRETVMGLSGEMAAESYLEKLRELVSEKDGTPNQ